MTRYPLFGGFRPDLAGLSSKGEKTPAPLLRVDFRRLKMRNAITRKMKQQNNDVSWPTKYIILV